MSIIVIPFIFTVGATIIASQHNSCNSVIYNDYNGNITDANISASAAIANSKLAQIITASTVSGAALTTLNLVPSGAGALLAKNGGTGADMSAALIGADPYFSATGVMNALAAGTIGQVKVSQGGAAPIWANSLANVLDYGTSSSVSTAKQGTATYICYGNISVANKSSTAITNLPFSSSTSYKVVANFVAGTLSLMNGPTAVTYVSGASCTIQNASDTTFVCSWIAVGT